MREVQHWIIPNNGNRQVRSLCWFGNDLVDWVSRGVRYRLDGTCEEPHPPFADRFDAAVAFPDGRYAAIYERLWTKGLILKEGRILREVNRSYYCADAYEYPVALLTLPDGRDALVHCPEEYNKLEIEEIESGNRLTSREGAPLDFFHSRLQVSPDGRFLLSAGWIWHPLDFIQVYSIEEALRNPESLDRNEEGAAVFIEGLDEANMAGFHSAAFVNNEAIIVAGATYRDEVPFLGVFSVPENRVVSRVPLEEPAGTLMPVGDHIVSFYEHPKLIDIRTGGVVHRWPELDSGRQNSSIIMSDAPMPPTALDPANFRFAVAGSEAITVIQLG